MAITNNNGTTPTKYPTDDASIMTTAKEYASRDFKTVMEVVANLTPDGLDVPSEQLVAQELINIKFNQIKESRTKRVSYFD